MKHFSRSERVGGQIQKILSEILQRDIHDPRLALTTITGVKMSRDLRLARIYFATAGDKHRKAAADLGFQSAAGFVKRTLAARLGLRYMPDLVFSYDESFDYGARIDNLLRAIDTDDGADHP